jgi:hypothetical protein
MAQTDKSREFLLLAAACERRAESHHDEELKAVFLRIAAEYRDLARQIEEPEKWQARQKDRVS